MGSKGDSYENALAETIIGLYKTEVIRHEWAMARDMEQWNLPLSRMGVVVERAPVDGSRWATFVLPTTSRPFTANARVRLSPKHSRKSVSGKPGAVHRAGWDSTQMDLSEPSMPEQRFKLTASNVAQFFKYRCDRRFRYEAVGAGDPGEGWNRLGSPVEAA